MDIDIVLDVEFTSSNIIMGDCLQIGLVAIPHRVKDEDIDKDEWIIDTLSVCFLPQGKELEPGVMAFWSKFPEIRSKIDAEAGPITDKMNELNTWLNKLSEKYKIKNFISDIASCDFAWFRSLYLTHVKTTDNVFELPYISICTHSMEHVFAKDESKDELKAYYKSERFPHTHYALDDAIKTAYEYLKLRKYIRDRYWKN